MRENRCINIDWLEVYCHEDAAQYPCNAEFFRKQHYWVDEREYGTRVYREMFTICNSHHEPVIEVRRNPFSDTSRDGGFFPPQSCHIRLHNSTCYNGNPIGTLRNFLARFNYTLVKIYRLDICYDFETFDKGDDPAKFIDRYIRRKYAKVNQSNISLHGEDRWNGINIHSISWGQPKSMVSTKFYCKSLELEQRHEKPYIRLAWFAAGLITDPISMTKRNKDGVIYKPLIWRIEFSIKSSAQRWFVIDKSIGKPGKIAMPHTLDIYDTPAKLENVFASLAMHYFRFKYYEEGVRKDRCKDKVLFEWSPNDTFYKVDRIASHISKTKPLSRLMADLRLYAQLHPNPDIYKAVECLCKYMQMDAVRNILPSDTDHLEALALGLLIEMKKKGEVVQDNAAELKKIVQSLLKDGLF